MAVCRSRGRVICGDVSYSGRCWVTRGDVVGSVAGRAISDSVTGSGSGRVKPGEGTYPARRNKPGDVGARSGSGSGRGKPGEGAYPARRNKPGDVGARSEKGDCSTVEGWLMLLGRLKGFLINPCLVVALLRRSSADDIRNFPNQVESHEVV